jgi:hypothetical protein
MPKRYEAMRDKFKTEMPCDMAQAKAAKIYSASKRPSEPKLSHKPKKRK